MEEIVRHFTGFIALISEGCAALFIAFGALESTYLLIRLHS
jgi:hypothetical protein